MIEAQYPFPWNPIEYMEYDMDWDLGEDMYQHLLAMIVRVE